MPASGRVGQRVLLVALDRDRVYLSATIALRARDSKRVYCVDHIPTAEAIWSRSRIVASVWSLGVKLPVFA